MVGNDPKLFMKIIPWMKLVSPVRTSCKSSSQHASAGADACVPSIHKKKDVDLIKMYKRGKQIIRPWVVWGKNWWRGGVEGLAIRSLTIVTLQS